MKGHQQFLTAFQRAAGRRGNVHVLVAGSGVQDQERQLREWAALHELDHRLHLLGPVEDVARLLPAVDILCSSSVWGESFPNIVGEAMASGVPCAVTDVGDSAALVGDTGRVVRAGDSEDLARAIGDLLDMTPDQRRARGLAARKRVQARFSPEVVYPRYEQVWREAVDGPKEIA
jgi:glycosyltransferase involved in cell wall biosynthesis